MIYLMLYISKNNARLKLTGHSHIILKYYWEPIGIHVLLSVSTSGSL